MLDRTLDRKLETSIREKVTSALNPELLDLVNESSGHRVPVNSETHFKLTVVSENFRGLSRVQRHQKIYGLLESERGSGLHALALWTYTPDEWEKLDSKDKMVSPSCLHKAKK